MIEVVAEFGPFLLFAFDYARHQMRVFPQVVAHLRQQRGVFGEALHQDIACAVQRGAHVGDAFVGIDILHRQLFGILRRILPQRFGQRLQTRFNRDLTAGAAFRLIRQIKVFEFGFTERAVNSAGEFVSQFALLVNRLQNRLAALFQFAQVAETRLQLAQLGVVQTAGHLFTIACDKRHGVPFVQQTHSGFNLLRTRLQLTGNNVAEIFHHRFCLAYRVEKQGTVIRTEK